MSIFVVLCYPRGLTDAARANAGAAVSAPPGGIAFIGIRDRETPAAMSLAGHRAALARRRAPRASAGLATVHGPADRRTRRRATPAARPAAAVNSVAFS